MNRRNSFLPVIQFFLENCVRSNFGQLRLQVFKNLRNLLIFAALWLRSTMDSMWVSGTQDLGSIPGGATDEHKIPRRLPGYFIFGGTRRTFTFLSGAEEIKSSCLRSWIFCILKMSSLRNSDPDVSGELSPGTTYQTLVL